MTYTYCTRTRTVDCRLRVQYINNLLTVSIKNILSTGTRTVATRTCTLRVDYNKQEGYPFALILATTLPM